MHATKTVSSDVMLSLLEPSGARTPVAATATYSALDPYAVLLVFHVGDDQEVEWVFARDLLFEGLSKRVGEGDVQVWPDLDPSRTEVHLVLSSPNGNAHLEVPVEPLVSFLSRTWSVVAHGQEGPVVSDRLDAELADVLRRGARRGV
jgi:hypothetical protein